jgi:hypothetical protein
MLSFSPANPSIALILVGGFGTRLRPLVNPLFFGLLYLAMLMLSIDIDPHPS